MKSQKLIRTAATVFILLSAFCFLSVSLMAFQNPQAVMDLVGVKLTNTDAYSSIRGVYGGVGLTIFISLIYLLRRNKLEALSLLSILWGMYAFSRLITIIVDGALGNFGTQWLVLEGIFFAIAICTYILHKKRLFKASTIH